jgi:hypothetical protein
MVRTSATACRIALPAVIANCTYSVRAVLSVRLLHEPHTRKRDADCYNDCCYCFFHISFFMWRTAPVGHLSKMAQIPF